MMHIPHLSILLKVQNLLPKFFIFTLLLVSATPAKAQITPDGTLGADRSVITPNTLIQSKNINADLITGGAQRGRNLFHSFGEFNVGEGQRVYFANPSDVTNILTRVTGGNQSKIFGTLGVDGAANLFLINPAGILFGSGATLDLRGSFVGTTANGVQFGTQGLFSATNPQAPPLLTIDPSGLLFNQLNQQGITVNNEFMGVPNGKSLLLVGGNVTLDGGGLIASGGRVELASLAAPGTIGLNVAGDALSLSLPTNVQRGNVSLRNQAFVDVSGAGGGDIAVNAGKLDMSNSSTLFAGIGTGMGNESSKAGNININADLVSLDSAYIDNVVVSSTSKGNAGNINITTGSLSATHGAQIDSFTRGIGNGGNITIVAKDAVTFDGINSSNGIHSGSYSNVYSGAIGNGGNTSISAGSLSLTNGAELNVDVYGAFENLDGGKGKGGIINVNVGDKLTISGSGSAISGELGSGAVGRGGDIKVQAGNISVTDGGTISSSTLGKGDAGNISITANDGISLSRNSFIVSNVQSSDAAGNAGNIDIKTGSLSVKDGSQINSFTRGHGNAGNITITAKNAVTFDQIGSDGFYSALQSNVYSGAVGNGGNINLSAGSLSLTNGGQINAFLDSGAVGRGGNIKVQAGNISVTDGGTISSSTLGQGNAGNISITANDGISLSRNSFIVSNVQSSDAVGNAGNIDINTASLSVQSGSQINSFTLGRGNSGNITITAKNAVTFDRIGSDGFYSALQSNVYSGAVGNGGNINLSAGSLSLTNGGQINAFLDSGAVGRGGNIKVQAGNISVTDGGTINSSTFGAGNSGDLTITADTIQLSGTSSRVSARSNSSATGNAGSLTINTGQLLVQNEAQVSASTFGAGNGGNLTVNAKTIQLNGISADGKTASGLFAQQGTSGARGNAGKLTISTQQLQVQNGAQVSASTFGAGNSGDLTITADTIQLSGTSSRVSARSNSSATGNAGSLTINAGQLFVQNEAQVSASTFGAGNGGNLTVNANTILLSGTSPDGKTASGLFAQQATLGARGNAGKLTINTQQLQVQNGALVSTSTFGAGNSGNLTVKADTILLTGSSSGLFNEANSGSTGNAGNLTINTRQILVQNGSGVYVQNLGKGNAGNLDIRARSIQLDKGILTGQTNSGIGGDIKLTVDDYILLRNTSKISTNATTAGDGGKITINTPFIVAVPNENNDITANAGSGSPGKIKINAQLFGIQPRQQLLPPANSITAFSQKGVQGQIVIAQPQVELIQGLIELPIQVSDAANKFSQLCPNSPNGKPLGEFVITGKGNIPPNPLQLLPGRNPDIPLATAEDMQEIRSIQAQEQKKKEEQQHSTKVARKKNKDNTLPSIVEAQGIVQTPDGQIYFVANANHATPSSQPTASVCPSQN
ncbi:filamentous hemagglutinin N-terminal domain-containing protein [Aetokthonos hydrillicola]|uniref:two-partner secretion domain-containing protein n=1 Tax=Aetokthonos hydrillicola TaxID=1550245 RepID=UPI001ABA51B9